jgi:hypothetical protein
MVDTSLKGEVSRKPFAAPTDVAFERLINTKHAVRADIAAVTDPLRCEAKRYLLV